MAVERKVKACLAASAGGHLNQLLKLDAAWGRHEYFLVTTNRIVAGELERRYGARVYVVIEANRENPLKIVKMLWQCARIMLRERPGAVVSTGAAPGCLLAYIGRMLGARVAWVDSIANVERLSLSGRLVRPIAEVFLTQWEDLADPARGVEYIGELM
jgi:UDP-N-acetylglucosamine:LPS N-acetylglucosamine transferase